MIKSLSTRVLVVGAALGLAGVLVLPAQPEGGQLASIAAAPDRFLAGSALNFLAATLIGAGLLILGQRAAGQGRRVRRRRGCRLAAAHRRDRHQRGVL